MNKKNNQNEKKIIQFLKILLEETLTREEIINKLNIKTATLYQYSSLIKACGFKISKRQNKYFIQSYENKIDFDELDESLISHIGVLGDIFLPNKKSKELKVVLDEIIHKAKFENGKNYKNKYNFFKKIKQKTQNDRKINLFEKALDKNLHLKVILNTSLKEHIFKPIEIKKSTSKTFFVFYDENENIIKEILPQKIIKLSPIEKEDFIEQSEDIIFELYGTLAKKYVLKENETILEKTNDKTIVLNSSHSPQKLFRRLLRYEDLCKITYPKKANEQFREIIKKSLDNITGLNDN